jgi:hypothetical protein
MVGKWKSRVEINVDLLKGGVGCCFILELLVIGLLVDCCFGRRFSLFLFATINFLTG